MAELKITRHDESLAFYIDGSLQFDTRDEGIYHESLALPAAALAAARFKRPLAALIQSDTAKWARVVKFAGIQPE